MSLRSLLISVAALGGLCSSAGAIVPGQTGEFPQTGDWSGKDWNWDNAHVYHWRSVWNGTEYTGSAVAVGQNWLLTAGHVNGNATDYTMINGERYSAIASYRPPNDPGQSNPPDLRLIKLDKTLPGYHKIYTGTLSKDQGVFLIGYGQTGTYNGIGTTWQSGTEGVGRWGTNRIATSVLTRASYSLTFRMDSFDSNTPYEAFAAGGDSGGGAFVKVGDEWQLAGIFTSAGSGSTYAVAVPAYSDWIVDTTGIPEPNGMGLLVTGVAAMTLTRRRRAAAE